MHSKTKPEQHQKINPVEVWVVSVGVSFPTKLLWEKLQFETLLL